MKRTAQTFFVVLLFASTVFGATQRYTVVMKSPVGVTRAGAMIRDIADPATAPVERHIRAYGIINGFSADLTPAEANALKAADNVAYVSPAVERHALDVIPAAKGSLDDLANPYAQVVPYGITMVHAPDVWPVSRGEGINVVVVDTGIDYTHPELSAVYAGGYNEVASNSDPKDDNGHGTHVSGTIAAADNNVGVVGVAPHVRLWSVKVLDSSGSGSSDNIIAALDWVEQQKAALGGDWVLNFSLGSSTPDPAERTAFQKAVADGLLICAASGNDSTAGLPAPIGYPANYTGVLAIGAIDSTKTIASFSDQGPNLAVVAPGVSVLSTVPMGTGSIAAVQSNVGSFGAAELQYASRGTVSGTFVNCGIGQTTDIPASVAGKIAVIERGTLNFSDKVHNATSAGAIGVVIYNKPGATDMGWTLGSTSDPTTQQSWPVVVGISNADGVKLLTGSGQITISDTASDYETLSGTSMATPHATGVAALAWSVAPQLAAADVVKALEANADDLGSTGFDTAYGNGLIDALAAAKALAPAKFGSPSTPATPPSPRLHIVRHH